MSGLSPGNDLRLGQRVWWWDARCIQSGEIVAIVADGLAYRVQPDDPDMGSLEFPRVHLSRVPPSTDAGREAGIQRRESAASRMESWDRYETGLYVIVLLLALLIGAAAWSS